MLLALSAALALIAFADTVPAPSAARLDSAYLDASAREMVRGARERRAVVDRSVVAYRVLARERISVGLRALSRDRVLYRREIAARVHWARGGVGHVEVLGARQVVPIAVPEPSLPDDLRSDAPDLAFDPARVPLLQDFGDGDFFRHPLAEGSEAHYRFRSGDTTRLRLSPERTVRLVELRVIPRRDHASLLSGSLWLDAETHSPVRATFRLAHPVDLERDLGEDDDDIPGVLKPITGELRYVTIDYGLWDQRWWLPRLIALEMVAQVGGMVAVPVRFERSYTEYEVAAEGDTAAYAAMLADVPPPGEADEQQPRRACGDDECRRYTVELPDDTLSLLHGEYLPPSIYAEGEGLITEGELRDLADAFGIAPPGMAGWRVPELRWSYLRPDLVRFNRVEGLALGGRVAADLGPATAEATAWLATARPDLSGELAVSREGLRTRHRIAGYRRVAAMEPDPRALGLGGSLSALLLGRDDGEYFRATGLELAGEPVAPGGAGIRWRLFAERHAPLDKETDFSLAGVLDSGRTMRPNLAADRADQVGGTVEIGVARGLDPRGYRWAAALQLGAETGSYRLVRPALSARGGFPLPMRLVGMLEAAGGTTLGEAPLQRHWFLGGPATVRGFAGSRLHGDSYWRGRAEVASALPAARLVLFTDAGWAGAREAWTVEPMLVSAGVGASLLDGLLRMDLARALRGGGGWRLDFRVDAPI